MRSNSKFCRMIRKHGEKLGSGCGRTGYMYGDMVYKLPHEENEQGDFEKHIYEMLPKKFLQFFPKVEFFGRVMRMTFVEVAEYWGVDYSALEDSGDYDEDQCGWENSDLNAFVHDHGLEFDSDTFGEFLDWIEAEGGDVEDILNNDSNFGFDPNTMELKIIDWGWSHDSW